jgi:bifunctional UDP-N-acetylglucosamine pyrophosphorylase/glucosamine-1-phosphate N-acetyltransferase
MSDLHIVVLAAGKGTRMKSTRPKVLHQIAGAALIDYVLDAAETLSPRSTTIVVGHQAETVKAALAGRRGLTFVVQEPQLGTAHALLAAEPAVKSASGTLVLLSGDVPRLSAQTLRTLVERHASTKASATVITAMVDEPHGYGRIVRSGEQIARIVEEKDATPAERQIREINAGIYAFALDGLFDAVRRVASHNAQGEHYLPDVVAHYRAGGRTVETVPASADEILGINSRAELAEVGRLVRQWKNAELMAAGVTIEDPSTTYIDRRVTIGPDTVIRPGVSILGATTIGRECELHSGVRIVSSRLGDRVTVLDHSLILDARVENDASVGPFTHLRPHVVVGERAKVGNFVEMKETVLGAGSKAMHLSYLGDAAIGANVNIGAGTITCNYDGVRKQKTTINDGAFIGSDSQLIAPVTVGAGAYVGTGTTVREDVPPGALAVSAGKQRNIAGWVEEKKTRSRGSAGS